MFLGTADAVAPGRRARLDGDADQGRIPDDAPIGTTEADGLRRRQEHRPGRLQVVDKKDTDASTTRVASRSIPTRRRTSKRSSRELKNVAQRDKVPELEEFANKIEKLLEKAENGEITKEQLLEELAKAEER